MMSIEEINRINDEITVRAEAMGAEPVEWREEYDLDDLRLIPNIGYYEPDGYIKLEEHFVDTTGLGRMDEPAMTIDAFLSILVPGHYYAIVEEGPFQAYIGEFEKVID